MREWFNLLQGLLGLHQLFDRVLDFFLLVCEHALLALGFLNLLGHVRHLRRHRIVDRLACFEHEAPADRGVAVDVLGELDKNII